MDSHMPGYALPESLVCTQIAADHLKDPSIKIVEGVRGP